MLFRQSVPVAWLGVHVALSRPQYASLQRCSRHLLRLGPNVCRRFCSISVLALRSGSTSCLQNPPSSEHSALVCQVEITSRNLSHRSDNVVELQLTRSTQSRLRDQTRPGTRFERLGFGGIWPPFRE